MAQMRGGDALVRSLVREGVRVVFGLPGVQIYGALAALRDEPAIRFITARHEQATSFMADGYARAGGGIGTALVVPGPGLLNASSGLSTAYSASSPVLMISGQVDRDKIGRNMGLLHEVNDQIDCVKPITKWQKRVLTAAEIPGAVHEAMRQLRTGRPRPVEIEMPPEAMLESGDVELLEPAIPERPVAEPDRMDRAAEMLSRSERPVIYAGGGVHLSGAHAELVALAELLQAPVIMSAEGKGAISDWHHLSLGAALMRDGPLRELFDSSDLVLAVGTRFMMASPPADRQVIQIDIDGDEIGRNHTQTYGLLGDARSILAGLTSRLGAEGRARPLRQVELDALRAKLRSPDLHLEPQQSIIESLRAGLPDDGILVAGMTQLGYYSRPAWPVYEPRTYIGPSYSGNLGFAFPTALGAKVARPDRPVLCISGDGGFMYNSQELATAVQHGINVVVVVFNDNAFGNVSRDMDLNFGGSYGSELHNPDFVRLAEAYGAVGMRSAKPTDVGRLVSEALELDRPALIEVPVGRMPMPRFFSARPRWAAHSKP